MKGLAAMVIAYNFAILAGCAWLVWNGWSPWWFALAACCLHSFKGGDE